MMSRLWAGGAAAILLTLPAAAAAQPAADLDWIPADAPGFVRLRVADLWKSDSTQELRKLLAKNQIDVNKEAEQIFGITPQEVECVTLCVPPPGGEPVIIVATAKPALERMLKPMRSPSKKKHKDYTYYETPEGTGALYAAGDRLFVTGRPKEVLELLDRAGVKKADGPLGDALKLAAGKAPLVACVNLAALGKDLKGSLPPQAEAALPLFEANPALITVVGNADIRVTVHLTCASDEDAKKKAQTLTTTLDILRQFIPVGRTELARDPVKGELEKWLLKQADTFLGDLQDGVKAAQIEAKGRAVHGQVRLKTNAGTLLTLTAGIFFARQASPPPAEAKPDKP